MSVSPTKKTHEKSHVVLAIYPHGKGIAYACMSTPTTMIESGQRFFHPICNRKCRKRAQNVLRYFCPDIVILEDEVSDIAFKRDRVTRLLGEIKHDAEELNLRVVQYKREHIREVFGQFGASTKHEIATKIAKWLPEYTKRVPKVRDICGSESSAMGEFDAISLAYTHFYLNMSDYSHESNTH
jgi:Holliday junction resolvasome RuvABC endonuclease subunit